MKNTKYRFIHSVLPRAERFILAIFTSSYVLLCTGGSDTLLMLTNTKINLKICVFFVWKGAEKIIRNYSVCVTDR